MHNVYLKRDCLTGIVIVNKLIFIDSCRIGIFVPIA